MIVVAFADRQNRQGTNLDKRQEVMMITAEFSRKIDTLSNDEYQMAELYVDNVVEYSKRRKKLGHGRRLKLISWSQKEE